MIFAFTSVAFSQQQKVKVDNLQPQSENFIFPLISYSQKPLVERKINTFLQVDALEFVPNSGKDPYHLASTATNSYQNYLYFYSWKKLETPRNILCLEMEGEASGAYPEGFTNYRNFDVRTGNFINLEDLFLPKFHSEIEKTINDQIKKRVKDYIVELQATRTRDKDEEEQIAMYEGCFTENTLGYLKFYFGKNEFTVVAGRCSNHALRALDDLGSHEIIFKYKEFEKYFSPFAKNLLSDSEQAITPGSIQNKLYQGKIDGKYPIMLLVNQIYDDDSFNCMYWYEKNKKLIEWRGTFRNNHISVTEDDYHSEELKKWIPRATIEADLKGTKIVGTWQDYKTKKNLKLELEEL